MKTNCEKYIQKINLLIDDSLNEKEKERLMEHIFSCPSCEQYYKDQLYIKNNISEVKLHLPADFSSIVMDKIYSENNQKKIKKINFRRTIKYSVSAVAACLVIIAGIFLYNNNMFTMKMSDDASMLEAAPEADFENSQFELSAVPEESMLVTMTAMGECESQEKSMDDRNYIMYDYLYENNDLSADNLLIKLKDEFMITDFNISDNCVIFNTDMETFKKIIETINLKQIENIDNLDRVITVKIISNNGE